MRAVKVGVDARALSGNRGIARYLRGMLGALAAARPDDEYRLLLPRGGPAVVPPGCVAVRDPRPGRILFGAAALTGRPRIDRLLGDGLDVVWAPAPAPLALSPGVPFVLTVHDLSFAVRPRDFTPYERLWHRLARPRRQVERAARVLADSAATRDELVARYGADPERITVVPPGVDAPAPGTAAPASRVRPYLLAVGALEPRKAPGVLAEAYRRARAQGLDADLVVAGEGRRAHLLTGPGVVRLGSVGDRELDGLYRGAVAVVLPSYLEGFGYPPLEAALRGTPSVVSDLPVFHETLGEAALRVPPGDPQALADALCRIVADGALRDALAHRAQAAAGGFTWSRAAAATRAVLAEAAAVP